LKLPRFQRCWCISVKQQKVRDEIWGIKWLSYVTNAALHCLHEAGWVHKDFSPGNIIVVGTNAKISDLEFAKRRAVDQLEQLTRPVGPSSPAVREVRTVGSFGEFRGFN